MPDVCVIGGGAAGLAAAISAAQQGSDVVLLEAKDRVGTSILATGNGRCNLTNTQVKSDAYNAPAFVAPTLEKYGTDRVLAFFKQLGLLTYEEREGRIYPLSNTATSVLDVLREGCTRLGVRIVCDAPVESIVHMGASYYANMPEGAQPARCLVVCTGGGTDLLQSCGHTIAPFRPALCALATEEDPIRGLSGIRATARVNVFEADKAQVPYAVEEGEVLFRDYGLSGIVIFDISRYVEPGQYLGIDFLPNYSEEEIVELLSDRLKALLASPSTDGLCARELLTGIFHSRVAGAILKSARVRPAAWPEQADIPKIAAVIKDFRLQVKGTAGTKNAQVVHGGALVDEFDPQTLESLRTPRIFAAGETLDVDARCGGFNLHWAWASGLVAGRSAARAR